MNDFDVFFVDDWFDENALDFLDYDGLITPINIVEEESPFDIKNEPIVAAVPKDVDIAVATVETNSEEPVQKKKRIRKRLPVPKKPVISPSDPRRHLIKIITDAYNSADLTAIWSFIQQHATKDIVFHSKTVGDVSDLLPAMQKPVLVQGRVQFCEYWYAHAVAIPDDTMVVLNTKLYVRSDGTSTIMSAVVLEGSPIVKNDIMARLRDSAVEASKAVTASGIQDIENDGNQNDADTVMERVMNRVGNAMKGITQHFTDTASLTETSDVTDEEGDATTATATATSASDAVLENKDNLLEPSNPLVISSSSSNWMVSPTKIKSLTRSLNVTMTFHLNAESKVDLIEFAYSSRKKK